MSNENKNKLLDIISSFPKDKMMKIVKILILYKRYKKLCQEKLISLKMFLYFKRCIRNLISC